GLVLCQQVIVEEGTRNITLVNSFNRLTVEAFPSAPQRFAVYTMLTNGRGAATLTLEISRTDTLEEIFTRSTRIAFADPLRHLRLWIRVRSCSFPVMGRYQVALLMDGDLITQCGCDVFQETSP